MSSLIEQEKINQTLTDCHPYSWENFQEEMDDYFSQYKYKL